MNEDMKKDIEKLDDNAKTILKQSLLVSLATVKQFEKRLLEAIDLLDSEKEEMENKHVEKNKI